MSRHPSLVAYGREVESPYGLLGVGENALTFALGFTFKQCPQLLRWFLREIGLPPIHRSLLSGTLISLQRKSADTGITDIEIHLPGHFHVIIEAKVGSSIPTKQQCQKYLSRLRDSDEPIQKLVAIVESPDRNFIKQYGKQDTKLAETLVCFPWPNLIPECSRLMSNSSVPEQAKVWVRNFHVFLEKEFAMKAFTTEVWILAINTKKLWKNGMSHWEIHQKHRVWWDYKEPSVRPLYLAFRVDGVVDGIYRVSRIEHGTPICDLVPEMKAIRRPWVTKPATIWHFGPRVPLERPLTTGGGMFNRRVRCDLDLLLTCDTVLEIESKMSKRRKISVD
jgi:hypothetical protein